MGRVLLSVQGAEAAFTGGVGVEGLSHFFGAEVRPEGWGEVELRIGGLPQQKVADTQFSAGADDEVRVGQAVGEQATGEGGFVYVVGSDIIPQQGSGRFKDLFAASVVERDAESDAGVVLRHVNDAVDGGGDVGADAVFASKVDEPRSLLVQARGVLLDGLGGERHQTFDFFGRTPPILG